MYQLCKRYDVDVDLHHNFQRKIQCTTYVKDNVFHTVHTLYVPKLFLCCTDDGCCKPKHVAVQLTNIFVIY